MVKKSIAVCVLGLLCTACAPVSRGGGWQQHVAQELPLLGHRNWIVIADEAYPLQSNPGIEAIDTGGEQLEVVKAVLAQLDRTQHVKPAIYTDAELPFVSEKNAPGIGAYRDALKTVLADRQVQVLPHEEIISKLDDAGKLFKVVILKTRFTKPYTSVFLQLECGYWNAASEAELREAMKHHP